MVINRRNGNVMLLNLHVSELDNPDFVNVKLQCNNYNYVIALIYLVYYIDGDIQCVIQKSFIS